jgi:hypothetical protein
MAGFWPPGQKPQKIGVGLGMTKIIKNQKNSKNPKVRGTLTFAKNAKNCKKTRNFKKTGP